MMFPKIVSQLSGHGTMVHSCGISRIVASHLYHANLVLHLHHDNRLLLSIMVAQMLHHAAEGALVGLQHVFAERRGFLNGFPFGSMGTGETLHVALEPFRGIAAHRVFPGTEPQQHHFQFVVPCLCQDGVERTHVEFPFLWFHQFPRQRNEHGVEPHLMKMREVALHILWHRG